MRIQQLALLALPAALCLSGVVSAQTGLTPASLKIARVAEADTFTLIEDEGTDDIQDTLLTNIVHFKDVDFTGPSHGFVCCVHDVLTTEGKSTCPHGCRGV